MILSGPLSLRSLIRLSLLALVCAGPPSLRADVTVPPLFSEHAVLQKRTQVPVWGKAAPGEKVTVSIAGVSATAETDAGSVWQVKLDLADKGPGPYEMVIEGKNKLTVPDVLIGEVWLCSGQSNMEWTLRNTVDATREIAASANPQLRQFLVIKKTAADPTDTLNGKWTIAGPATSGDFTAVGYYFGKDLQAKLKTPVGLIHTSWGGTPVEAWTSLGALDSVPELQEGSDKLRAEARAYPEQLAAWVAKFHAWTAKNDRPDKKSAPASEFASPDAPTDDWKLLHLPGSVSQVTLPDAGAVWFRRDFTVPPAVAQAPPPLDLGDIQGFDAVYINGVLVAASTPESGAPASPRRYYLPHQFLKEGKVTLAVRVYNPAGGLGIKGADGALHLGSVPLAGDWFIRSEYSFPPLNDMARADYPQAPKRPNGEQNVAAYLYNAMIHPLLPYAMRGAIWYQGEANVGRAFDYRAAFPLMIRDWRTHWREGDFPFYWCQLANFMSHQAQPGNSAWAELREAQHLALSLPQTGEAVLIDAGEEGSIHPRDKSIPGGRLAKIALAQTYGQKEPYAGPTYESMAVDGDAARLKFSHGDGGLTARPLPEKYALVSTEPATVPLVRHSPQAQLEGFAVCGEDKKWVWATSASIENDTVVVRAAGIAKPMAVRYAWADNPVCNLYNGAGLPASPFRTDDFPGGTVNSHYGK